MTKMKNTKKGMAKKTLSISLAVAMLATSNVPVWAAEFSDGSDVAFTSEAPAEEAVEEVEAPVVEDEVAPEAEVAADYTLDTNMELASGTWNDTVKLVKKDGVTDAAKFEFSKNGVPVALTDITYEVYYNDDMIGSAGKISAIKDSMQLMSAAPGLDAYKGGKKVTVKFYVSGEKEAVATLETTLKAVDLSAAVIGYTTPYQLYNGKSQRPNEAELTVTVNGTAVASDAYVVKFADDKEAKNYEKGGYKFAVEGVADKGYTGTSDYSGIFTVGRVDANKDNLSVVLSGEATYNGENTEPTVVVTDKLSGATIPAELYTVTLTSKNVGEYTSDNATITMIESAKVGSDTKETYNNFKVGAVSKECVTGSFKINALDLSKLGDKYTVEVKPQEVGSVTTLDWSKDIILTDKSTGKVVTASDVLPTEDISAVITNNATAGTGRLTIKATDVKNQNIINEYVTNVTVAKNVVTKKDVALPKGTKLTSTSTALESRTPLDKLETDIQKVLDATVYTGSAVEPLKSVFENIVWVNDAPNGEDLKFVLGKDYTLTYSENKDSYAVSGKKATVTLKFQGDYVGTVSYDFEIQQAEATVTGEDIAYTPGKNSYDANVKVVVKSGTTETAVPTTEYIVKTTQKARKIGDKALADVVFTNPNYIIKGSTDKNADKCAYVKNVESKLVGKSLEAESVTAVIEGTYTYTGKEITPTIVVKDGDSVLKLGTDYKIVAKHGTEAGEAYVTIEGMGNYSGKLTLKYTIEKADLATAVVLNKAGKENYDVSYDGLAQKPDVAQVKIGDTKLVEYNPITKTGDYEITWDLDAVEVGTYEFTITAVASSTKVQGTFKGTYKVIPSELKAHFAKKSAPGTAVTHLNKAETGAYYTGKAYTVDDFKTKVVVYGKEAGKVLTEGTDYRLVYENNVDAGNKATVKAYGIGNHAYKNDKGEEVAIATLTFEIDAKDVINSRWIRKINDVEYAGGLPVEPEVVVADNNNNRLVQGVDYTVVTDVKEIGDYTQANITIKGKGAYVAGNLDNNGVKGISLTWKVTKKDMKNTVISVDKNNNVIVMNGTVVVPSTEYTVAFSEDGSKVTVTAKADSKYYTGSKEQDVDVAKVGQAMISNVKVVGNKATVVLSGVVDNAEGYDYVIATEEDYKNGRVDITKNQLKTTGDFTYVQKGVYYAYCHAWKRDENNKKVFGEWSNLFQFTVTATTPDTPIITNVTRSGSTVKVTYKAAKNAEGYDVVLGSARKKVNGELRPVEYGKLVQKNKTTTTVTFKNVPAGSYYVGMHAYNRTSVDNKKVFSPWANWSSRVTVK